MRADHPDTGSFFHACSHLALIPEAIAFSIIAGVDPKVGLYASFSIAVVTAVAGGRPGMISAATAATAVQLSLPSCSAGARRQLVGTLREQA